MISTATHTDGRTSRSLRLVLIAFVVLAATVVLAASAASLSASSSSTEAALQAAGFSTPTTTVPTSGVGSADTRQSRVSVEDFDLEFLGRPGSVAAGFDRYFRMTVEGLGVTTSCTGSFTPAGHCTWAEYYWGRTSTSGSAYQTGDNVPVYFDSVSQTVWFIFRVDAQIESGDWEVTQGNTQHSMSITCDTHTQILLDDWPVSGPHDDVWHDVRVCQGSVTGLSEQAGRVSVPERAEDFEVQVLAGSDRIGRGGQDMELRLRLVVPTGEVIFRLVGEPLIIKVPIANAPVDAFVATGHSREALVMCHVTPSATVPSPNSANTCLTDPNGVFVVRYSVPIEAVNAPRRGQDSLRIYIDLNRDGTHGSTSGQSGREPSSTLSVPIAKAVNYVALGDSYSAGETGESPSSGAYITGQNPADSECRRWDQAYPFIFADEVRGGSEPLIDVSFETFACIGAITHNIYNPADADGNSFNLGHIDTNRPAAAAPEIRRIENLQTGQFELLPVRGWEPRQAVSLASAQQLQDVDMVTVTIGGNDAGFADALKLCARVNECDPDASDALFRTVEERVLDALERVKNVAPDAAVFVLGYPYVTPEVDPCDNPEEVRRPGRPPTTELVFGSALCEAQWNMYYGAIDECDTLSAKGVLRGSGWYVFGFLLQGLLGDERTRIDYREAKVLWASADKLNAAVRDAASRAGVHFVDVVGGIPLEDAPSGFVGHSSCNSDDPWLNGFVAKSGLLRDFSGADESSFHPTAAGQDAYARILDEYIRLQVEAGAELNDAGLPTSPVEPDESSSNTRGSALRRFAGEPKGVVSGTRSGGGPGAAVKTAQNEPSVGALLPRAVVEVSGCGAPFVSPTEQVRLVAAGFAADTRVTFTTRAVSLGDAELTAPMVASVMADADGVIDISWTVPAAPAASADPAPRAYVVDATGSGTTGATHTAYMVEPLIAYPGTAPCAVADAATVSLGGSARIAVLADDIAPTAGSLDVTSVEIRRAVGGTFTADGTTGAVTFTADPGFYGVAEGSYVVYDGWGIGTLADITVIVGAGCTITGTAGDYLIEGTSGDDVICVPDPGDRRAFHVIDASGGNDTIIGGAGIEWVYGGDGDDVVYGRGGNDRIVAGAGTDTVYGGTGMDYVYSADLGDTVIDGDGGYELVVAPSVTVPRAGPQANNDWQHVDVAQTVIIDVLGNDHDLNSDIDISTLSITTEPANGAAEILETAYSGRVAQYTAGNSAGSDSFAYEICDALGECDTARVEIMVGSADCTIVGTEADDTLRGTLGDDLICGLGGDDIIYGLGGDDIIVGGPGVDTLYGGDATLVGAFDGDDLLWGGAGDDFLYGGNGYDSLWGGDGDDTLHGNRRDDRIFGGSGDDIAVGGGERDRIWGGSGDDTLDGHAGNDTVWGGPGVDRLRGGNGDDTLWGNNGDDILVGGAGSDSLHGGFGDDDLDGSSQNDTLWGGPGDDTLDGRGHDDELHGGSDDDTLRGGTANDRVYGGSGDDTLDGGNGQDHLDGGSDIDFCTRGGTRARCETGAPS